MTAPLTDERENSATEVVVRTGRAAVIGTGAAWAGAAAGTATGAWAGAALATAVGGPIGFVVGLHVVFAVGWAGDQAHSALRRR